MDQQLLVFITVAEKENFSRAAEELHMTQPAVSQYIQTLERTMGTRLLERNNKYVRLNKSGEILYHHAKEILGLYTKMQHLIDDLTNQASGPILIGASYTFGEYILPHFLSKIHKQYPEINPSVTIGNSRNIAELVINHQLEVGIIEGEYTDSHLLIEPFANDSMFIVAAPHHPLAISEQKIPACELESATWIVREKGSGTRESTEKVLHELDLTTARRMEFGSTQLIKEVVEAGMGITLLSRWAIQRELANGTLAIIPVETLPFTRKFSLVTRSPYRTKALDVFLNLIKNPETLASIAKTDF